MAICRREREADQQRVFVFTGLDLAWNRVNIASKYILSIMATKKLNLSNISMIIEIIVWLTKCQNTVKTCHQITFFRARGDILKLVVLFKNSPTQDNEKFKLMEK